MKVSLEETRRPMKFHYTSGDRPLDGYTIKRGVGLGGFGEVYYAVSDGGKEVALKLVQRNLDVELRGVGQCLNLKDPHLVAIYDVRQTEQGECWVVMEYVSGESLEQVIQRNPQGLPPSEAVRWIHGIAEGVRYLHGQGIVHRDLKPANIFLEAARVKIGDYGLAKFVSASRRSGQTESVGTVHYMAPEVSQGRYGKEIDIYAIGIILYEVLTGNVPFEGESVGEILMKHLTAEPDVGDLPQPFRRVVARALEKDPARRYRSMQELLADLDGHAAAASAEFPGQAAARWDASRPRPGGQEAAPEFNQSPRRPADGWDGSAAYGRGADASGGSFWAQFGREDPLVRWTRARSERLSRDFVANPVWVLFKLVLLLFLAVIFWPLTMGLVLLAFVYLGLALLARWWHGPGGHPRRLAPHGRQSPHAEAAVERHQGPPVAPAAHRAQPHRGPLQGAGKTSPAEPVPPSKPKTTNQKMTEAIAAMLMAAMLIPILSIASVLVLPIDKPEELVFLAVTAIVGSWAVMVPAKCWEGNAGDAVWRRVAMMAVGLVVGVFAAFADRFLIVDLQYEFPRFIAYEHGFRPLGGILHEVNGQPSLWGYAVFFGYLFLLPRWWMQADACRAKRFRIRSVLVAGLWALVLVSLLPFPTLWGLSCAVLISLAVQFSSPWDGVPRQRRRREVAA